MPFESRDRESAISRAHPVLLQRNSTTFRPDRPRILLRSNATPITNAL